MINTDVLRVELASQWSVHVASCACECDIEVKPCLASPCSYAACPELLCTDLCNGVSPGLLSCCASPFVCVLCVSRTLFELLSVSQDVKKQAEKMQKRNHITGLLQLHT